MFFKVKFKKGLLHFLFLAFALLYFYISIPHTSAQVFVLSCEISATPDGEGGASVDWSVSINPRTQDVDYVLGDVYLEPNGGAPFHIGGGSSDGEAMGSINVEGLNDGDYTVSVFGESQVFGNEGPSCQDSVVFTISSESSPGEVTINSFSNVVSDWTIDGPDGNDFTHIDATAPAPDEGPAGEYTIYPADITCYVYSVAEGQTQVAGEGDTITFTINYQHIPGCGEFDLHKVVCYNWPDPAMEVSWTAATGATSYEIWRSVNGGSYSLYSTDFNPDGADWDFHDENVTNGNTYSYRIRALSSGVESNERSETVSEANCGGGEEDPPSPPGSCIDNANVFYSIPFPATLTPGQVVGFNLRATNTGNTEWYHGSVYKMGQTSALNVSPVNPGMGADPGDYWEGSYTLTAPATYGDYALSFRAYHTTVGGYEKPDGTMCSAPGSDTPFGNTATAIFSVAPPTHSIQVNSSGVSSVPINSSTGHSGTTNYSLNLPSGTFIVLGASLTHSGGNFINWTGCDGTFNWLGTLDGCAISFTSDRTVTANYSPVYTIAVNSSGASSVPIDSSTGHIGTTNYSLNLPSGTFIVLGAPVSYLGSTFSNWTGCGGTFNWLGTLDGCAVDLTSDYTVTANYLNTFNYSLSNSGTVEVTRSAVTEHGNSTITKTLTSGTGQPVTITATGMPPGVTVSYDGNRSCSPTCFSVITFNVDPSTAAGDYTITITGSLFGRTTQFTLRIEEGESAAVTCSASPSPAMLGETVTWTANLTGGTPPFFYSWSGTNIPDSPAPDTNPFEIIYGSVGVKSASVTVNGEETACTPLTIIIDPDFEEF